MNDEERRLRAFAAQRHEAVRCRSVRGLGGLRGTCGACGGGSRPTSTRATGHHALHDLGQLLDVAAGAQFGRWKGNAKALLHAQEQFEGHQRIEAHFFERALVFQLRRGGAQHTGHDFTHVMQHHGRALARRCGQNSRAGLRLAFFIIGGCLHQLLKARWHAAVARQALSHLPVHAQEAQLRRIRRDHAAQHAPGLKRRDAGDAAGLQIGDHLLVASGEAHIRDRAPVHRQRGESQRAAVMREGVHERVRCGVVPLAA